MTQFVESLRRLYSVDKIDKIKIDKLLSLQKITSQEYEYIVSVKNAI